jgi:hypothetical protein
MSRYGWPAVNDMAFPVVVVAAAALFAWGHPRAPGKSGLRS